MHVSTLISASRFSGSIDHGEEPSIKNIQSGASIPYGFKTRSLFCLSHLEDSGTTDEVRSDKHSTTVPLARRLYRRSFQLERRMKISGSHQPNKLGKSSFSLPEGGSSSPTSPDLKIFPSSSATPFTNDHIQSFPDSLIGGSSHHARHNNERTGDVAHNHHGHEVTNQEGNHEGNGNSHSAPGHDPQGGPHDRTENSHSNGNQISSSNSFRSQHQNSQGNAHNSSPIDRLSGNSHQTPHQMSRVNSRNGSPMEHSNGRPHDSQEKGQNGSPKHRHNGNNNGQNEHRGYYRNPSQRSFTDRLKGSFKILAHGADHDQRYNRLSSVTLREHDEKTFKRNGKKKVSRDEVEKIVHKILAEQHGAGGSHQSHSPRPDTAHSNRATNHDDDGYRHQPADNGRGNHGGGNNRRPDRQTSGSSHPSNQEKKPWYKKDRWKVSGKIGVALVAAGTTAAAMTAARGYMQNGRGARESGAAATRNANATVATAIHNGSMNPDGTPNPPDPKPPPSPPPPPPPPPKPVNEAPVYNVFMPPQTGYPVSPQQPSQQQGSQAVPQQPVIQQPTQPMQPMQVQQQQPPQRNQKRSVSDDEIRKRAVIAASNDPRFRSYLGKLRTKRRWPLRLD